jgi:heterodisulfide reductase subunit B
VKMAFYPGCSLESTSREYRDSALLVVRALGIEIEEIADWICCGSTPAHMSDDLLGIALPSYNLQLVERMEAEGVLVPCASCYSRLKAANNAVKSDPDKRQKVAEVLGEEYGGGVAVRHMIEPIDEIIRQPDFGSRLKQQLTGLKVASYYGCLLVRPPEITGFDDPEDPQSLDRMVKAVGAVPVRWRYKVECCGAALAFARPEIVEKLSGEILQDAKDSGADVVIVACPLCQSNLDLRQRDIEKFLGMDLEIPVLYFTQLLGLALGFSWKELGLDRHTINPVPLLRKHGIAVRGR